MSDLIQPFNRKKITTLADMVSAINLQNKLILIKASMCKGLAEDFEYLLQEVWYIYTSHRQDREAFTSHILCLF